MKKLSVGFEAVPQDFATNFNLCTALHCSALHCTALHYTALHCTILYFLFIAQLLSSLLEKEGGDK